MIQCDTGLCRSQEARRARPLLAHACTRADERTQAHTRALRPRCCVQDKEKSLVDQRRYSLIDPASAPELQRLQRQLMSTEDALRDALDQAQQVEKLMEAMRSCPDKSQVSPGPGLGGPGGALCHRKHGPVLGTLVCERGDCPPGVPTRGNTQLDPGELRLSWDVALP